MKKTLFVLAALSLVFVSAEAKKKKKEPVAPVVVAPIFANQVDSMSYALGMNVGADFGKNLKNIPGGKTNLDLLIKGFSASLKGDSTLFKSEFAVEYFRNYITKAQEVEAEAKKAAGIQFLNENKTKEGVVTTASGLQYQVITPATGPKPTSVDSVKVHYQGFLVDGTKFDSSVDRGEPITFPLNGVIPGWTEGVQLMSVGSKYKFFVPSELGYGERGAGNVIPPFATLIFEVELLDIKPFVAPKPTTEVKAVPLTPAKKAPAKKVKK